MSRSTDVNYTDKSGDLSKRGQIDIYGNGHDAVARQRDREITKRKASIQDLGAWGEPA
jgi:hypothetical protein